MYDNWALICSYVCCERPLVFWSLFVFVLQKNINKHFDYHSSGIILITVMRGTFLETVHNLKTRH